MPKKKEKEYLKEHWREIDKVHLSIKDAEGMRRDWEQRGYEVQFYKLNTDSKDAIRLAVRKLSSVALIKAKEKERKEFYKSMEEESKKLRKELYGSRKLPRITPKTPRLRR